LTRTDWNNFGMIDIVIDPVELEKKPELELVHG
jgi:hypothetical protein